MLLLPRQRQIALMQHQYGEPIQPVPPPGDLFLDIFPGTNLFSGMSLRKLKGSYSGPCIAVRRDGGTTVDIGFANDVVDEAAIAAHCLSSIGFVETWYDQSGQGNHFTQSDPSLQSRIYDGSVVYSFNGKPSTFWPTSTVLRLDCSNNLIDDNICLVAVAKADSAQNGTALFSASAASPDYGLWVRLATTAGSPPQVWLSDDGTGFDIITHPDGFTLTDQKLLVVDKSGTTLKTRLDGVEDINTVSATLFSSASQKTVLGNLEGFPRAWQGYIQELIYYGNSQDGQLSAMEGNINTFYSIFP